MPLGESKSSIRDMNTARVLHTVAPACAWRELLVCSLRAGPTFLDAFVTRAYGLGFCAVWGIAKPIAEGLGLASLFEAISLSPKLCANSVAEASATVKSPFNSFEKPWVHQAAGDAPRVMSQTVCPR